MTLPRWIPTFLAAWSLGWLTTWAAGVDVESAYAGRIAATS